MSNILDRNPTRRFLDLKVHEVSLVDTPANEQAFLVAKRQEDLDMPATSEEAKKDASAVQVPIEVSKSDNESVKTAMDQVIGLVDGIAKAAGVKLESPSKEDSDDADSSAVDTEKGGMAGMRKMFKAQLEAAGMNGDKLNKAMEKFDKNFGQMMEKTQKSTENTDDSVSDTSKSAGYDEDTVFATLDAIHKARVFTPPRIEKLKAAIEELQKLMMEVVTPGSSPSTKVPGVREHSNPNTTRAALVGTSKSTEDLVEKLQKIEELVSKIETSSGNSADSKITKKADSNEELLDAIKSIASRLEKLEGARPASQSEGDDDGRPVTKSSGVSWKNIL